MRVLIDTDIVLDFFLDRKPFSDEATKIFALCEAKRVQGFITPVICSNVYYILRQTASHERIIEKLNLLMNFIGVLDMGRGTIIQALGSGFRDFEDALQHYSAVQSDFIDGILTRNVKDFKKSEIGVLTPEGFLGIIT
ncbi:MAG: PIN domain-containing protein [Bacteroidota bacterium]